MFGAGSDKQYFVENLSMLLGSGMDIIRVLRTLESEMHSTRMKRAVVTMREEIEGGATISDTLARTGLFPPHAIALIRIGEQSGKLSENLKLIAAQTEKDRTFRSRALSAVMYPVFVLGLTFIIGIGISWFILPRLATVFMNLRVKLPLITQYLIAIGSFFSAHGIVAVPAAIAIFLGVIFFLFIFSKTRATGQWLLFMTPGVGRLIQEVELARFGYILGTLLDAGLPIVDALRALAAASPIPPYRRLYEGFAVCIEDGNSFQKTFELVKVRGIIPLPVLQMIVSAEESGRLVPALLSVGAIFETKSEITTKNLTVILEPILLVIVWLGVVGVALAVILPIYSLLSGITNN